MRYEWADHETFGVEEGAVLFGVDHGSLFFVDEQTRDLLARWRATAQFDPDRIPPAERDILQGLRDIRILVPAGESPMYPPLAPDPGDIPLETMVLEVAQDCNLRCRYCYAGGGSYGKPVRLLEPATARKAVRMLVEKSRGRERVTLILFGGEPLLNMEAVTAAVEEAEALAELSGKEVFVSLTTNGTLLTPEIVAFIRCHRIAVAVSMDGPADLHDANRARAGGEGSYAGIVSRLSGLIDGATAPVAARVTLIPEQWSRVEEVFDHLLGLGFHEVGIAPASPIDRVLLPEPDQEERLFQGFSALARRFVQAAARGKVLPFGNLIDLLARLHVGQTKTVACGAGLGYLAVDAEGSFYVCHRLTGDDLFRVGTLDTGPDAERIRNVLEKATAGKDALCGRCWARTLCSGGCHYENHLRENRLGLPPGSSCHFIRRWLRLGIETYAELRRSGADAVLQRLEKRAKC
jgi:uncharacterized protein